MVPQDLPSSRTQPPVRRAEFTLYFEAVTLDIPVIARLQNKWLETYSAVRQRPPLPRPSELPSSGADWSRSSWPMPGVDQSNKKFNPILSYQSDQMTLAWAFQPGEDGEDDYPGFDTLSKELLGRFAEFSEILDMVGRGPIAIQGASSYYSNSIGEMESIEFVFGALSNWQVAGNYSRSKLGLDYVGLRVHRAVSNKKLGTAISGWIEVDEGESQPGEVDFNFLSIPTDGFEILDDGPLAVAVALLADSHDHAIDSFRTVFSTSWPSVKAGDDRV